MNPRLLLVALGLCVGPPVRAQQLAPAKPGATATTPVAPAVAAAVPPEAVAASQRRAVAKYPELGRAESPLRARFLARYRTLQIEQSPRLGQANWPESIAEELAAAPAVNVLAPAAAAPAAGVTAAPLPAPSPAAPSPSPGPAALPAGGATTTTAPTATPAAIPAAASDPQRVWVNGYTRADGTRVQGYWRKR